MEITRYKRSSPIDLTLWFGEAYDGKLHVNLSASRDTAVTGFTLKFGGEETDFGLFIGLPWIGNVHVSLCRLLPQSWRSAAYAWAVQRNDAINNAIGHKEVYAYQLDPFDGRVTGVTLCDDHLSLKLWNNNQGWSQRDATVAPWNGNGWYKGFFLRDVFLGDEKHTSHVVATRSLICQMPEGDYAVEAEISHVTRKRALTSTKHAYRVTLKCDSGIPLPGKGENSYDCGEDAVFSWTSAEFSASEFGHDDGFGRDYFNASLVERVTNHYAQRLTNDIMARRQRYGGSDWRPSVAT